MKDEIIIPTITKKFEKFDIENFNKKEENIYIKTKDGYINNMLQSFGYGQHIIFDNSCFSIEKLYYKTGNIKLKGIIFNNGSAQYGICYHFDKAGNLVKEENTDEGYDFGWEDIFKYCKENNIVLGKGYPKRGDFTNDISRYEKNGKKVWEIECCLNYETDEYLRVIIDGKTGKEISRETIQIIGN